MHNQLPHILTYPLGVAGWPTAPVVRIVANNLRVGETFRFPVRDSNHVIDAIFEVTEIINQRPARGTWAKVPTYFECIMSFVA